MKEVAGIKMFTAPEIAKTLEVSLSGVYRLIKNRKLTATKIGRNLMISEENLKKYLNGQY